jgi:hypothetical protein
MTLRAPEKKQRKERPLRRAKPPLRHDLGFSTPRNTKNTEFPPRGEHNYDFSLRLLAAQDT